MTSQVFPVFSLKSVSARPLSALLAVLAASTLSMTSAESQAADTPASPGQNAVDTGSSASQWSIGLAGGKNYRVYRDFDDKIGGLPLVTYENRYVHVFGTGLDVKLPSLGPVSFRLRGKYIGEGYESGDSPYLRGMSDRDNSFWVGGAAIWKSDFATLTTEVLTDAMDNSKGSRARLQIDRRFSAGAFGFTPRLAGEWVDSNYVDYYYGVMPNEVRTGRPAYKGEATMNTEAGLRIDWRPARAHTLFLDLGATRMGNEIKNSPLVETDTQYGVGFGYFYRF
ncbi:MipA/OmpV family protein [Pseudomonas sp. NPDC089734]|uniref:MipA/OmpV family protein n=1 Tax=Pseudomonas sp. NPDC089734 TaxID=3364469 RepID=UPI00380F7B63